MSNNDSQHENEATHEGSNGLQPERVSRRQFLTYSIASVGGFLLSTTLFPMVRMAIDPVLKHGEQGEFVKIGKLDDFDETPQEIPFEVPIKDGWYETKQKQTAWVMKDENGDILALSPICTHLGCTVNWEGGGHTDRFFCPCHFGLYYKNGLNVPNTPPPQPLDKYEVRIEGDDVYLGPIQPNDVTEKPKGEA